MPDRDIARRIMAIARRAGAGSKSAQKKMKRISARLRAADPSLLEGYLENGVMPAPVGPSPIEEMRMRIAEEEQTRMRTRADQVREAVHHTLRTTFRLDGQDETNRSR